MTEFKDRLNEGLALRRMSAAELARLSGVNEGAISQYRKGNYKANQYNLDKIAKALNVSIPWLMGADVPITPSIPNASNIFPIERKRFPFSAKSPAENLYCQKKFLTAMYNAMVMCTLISACVPKGIA